MTAGSTPAPFTPTRLERWVSGDGWLLELLLPRTDAGVVVQIVVVAVVMLALLPLARRAHLLQLWAGGSIFVAGLFVLRAVH